MLGLRLCVRAFFSCGERGPPFIPVCGPLTIVASLVAEHRLQTRRLSSCGSRAQLLRGMWDLPRPGLEPMSPALAGRFSTTAPPGMPNWWLFLRLTMSLLIFCLLDLSIFEKGVLQSPTMIIDSSVSPCSSVSFCHTVLGSIVRCIHVKDCYVILANWPLYHDVMPIFIPDNFPYFEVFSVWN